MSQSTYLHQYAPKQESVDEFLRRQENEHLKAENSTLREQNLLFEAELQKLVRAGGLGSDVFGKLFMEKIELTKEVSHLERENEELRGDHAKLEERIKELEKSAQAHEAQGDGRQPEGNSDGDWNPYVSTGGQSGGIINWKKANRPRSIHEPATNVASSATVAVAVRMLFVDDVAITDTTRVDVLAFWTDRREMVGFCGLWIRGEAFDMKLR
jgi:cell division protein FtsB